MGYAPNRMLYVGLFDRGCPGWVPRTPLNFPDSLGTIPMEMQICSRLLRSSMYACLFALFFIWSGPLSHAADSGGCINRKVTFDGTINLHYATVRAAPGPRLYLHMRYPEHCLPEKQASCPASAYLVPGNAVAVGGVCGRWGYVQYIGEKRISEGWVESDALSPIPPPRPPKPPVIKIGKEVLPPPSAQRYHFELTRGEGKPVCEAYLQRLNQTEFFSPPYCGRPESTLVPGFAALHRRYLGPSEYKMMYFQALAVLSDQPVYQYYKSLKNPNGSVTLVPSHDRNFPGFTSGAWTYDPPLDIENSRQGDNVIMWTTESRYYSFCGTPDSRNGSLTPGSSAGLVAFPGGRTIDSPATYSVFGISGLSSYLPRIFPEFSHEFGVFRYRSQNYFDGFLTGSRHLSAGGGLKLDPRLRDTLAVFLYTHKHRREVCEYYVSGLGSRP